MILYKLHSRKGKTTLSQSRPAVAKGRDGTNYKTAKVTGGNRNVLYLDCSSGCKTACLSNSSLEMGESYFV